MELLYLALGGGVLALLFAIVTTQRVLREDTGNDTMRAIAALIQAGAAAFLRREYTFLAGFVAVVAVVIAVFVDNDVTGKFAALGIVEAGAYTGLPRTAIAYVLGAIASGTAGYVGMFIAVRANVRASADHLRHGSHVIEDLTGGLDPRELAQALPQVALRFDVQGARDVGIGHDGEPLLFQASRYQVKVIRIVVDQQDETSMWGTHRQDSSPLPDCRGGRTGAHSNTSRPGKHPREIPRPPAPVAGTPVAGLKGWTV